MSETREYRVIEVNLEHLQGRIEKLNKRARKLGCQEIQVQVTNEEFIQVGMAGSDFTETVKMLTVTVTGEAPVIAGWKFVATLQHEQTGTILRTVRGEEIPERYREADASVCEHCNMNRRRKDTYIVRNVETNECKQVGRTCLKDFTGHTNPESIARWFDDVLTELDKLTEGSEGGYGEAPRYLETRTYLAHVAACIRLDGWVSKTKAMQDHCWATAGAAEYYMVGWTRALRLTPGEKAEIANLQPVERDFDMADKSIEWARTELAAKANKSDYEHNLDVVMKMDYLGYREQGIAASCVAVYQRKLRRNEERQAQERVGTNSSHVGEVGKRMNIKVTVLDRRICESHFGTTSLHRMIDESGNILKWFASNCELEIGRTYQMKATVKKHDEFRGIKETLVTRCAVQN
ncbi:MAG: hypothetical protein M0P69_09945 [Bacteroidales bacterium]|nr:hypothetical protein [Bacteroidales bacterium]